MKRILLSTLAAGAMLAGVAHASAAEYVFRYRGKMPTVSVSLPAPVMNDLFSEVFPFYFGFTVDDPAAASVTPEQVSHYLIEWIEPAFGNETEDAFAAKFGMTIRDPEAGTVPLADLIDFFNHHAF